MFSTWQLIIILAILAVMYILAPNKKNEGYNRALSDIETEIAKMGYPTAGIGCGLEDNEITDRYDAAAYGWNEAIERVIEIIENAEK